MARRPALGFLDVPLALALASLFFLAPRWAGLGSSSPAAAPVLEITVSGEVRNEPLLPDRTFSLSGPLGETVVETRSGAVRVVSSPCPNQLCVREGAVHRPGSMVACVPNRVVLRVTGGEEGKEGVDAVSR